MKSRIGPPSSPDQTKYTFFRPAPVLLVSLPSGPFSRIRTLPLILNGSSPTYRAWSFLSVLRYGNVTAAALSTGTRYSTGGAPSSVGCTVGNAVTNDVAFFE